MARGAKRIAGGLTTGCCLSLLVLLFADGDAAGQSTLPGQPAPREWLAIPAGGLSVDDAGDLVLESLALTLAPERVEASYRLVNEAASDRLVSFGFPFPRLTRPAGDGPALSGVFSDATLTVDGRDQPLASVRLRVFMRDADVTATLEAAGIEVQSLLTAIPEEQPRERRRAMEQALVDAGIAVDPLGWSVAVEPVWRVTLPAEAPVLATLSYRPYPGRSVDQIPGDTVLEDLADLSAYCADDQPGLLAWVQAQSATRAEVDRRRLRAEGQFPDEVAENAVGEIELLDLGFVWRNGTWPDSYPEVSLSIDAGAGRAAFCLPGSAPPERGDDGVYRAILTDLPADGRLDLLFLR